MSSLNSDDQKAFEFLVSQTPRSRNAQKFSGDESGFSSLDEKERHEAAALLRADTEPSHPPSLPLLNFDHAGDSGFSSEERLGSGLSAFVTENEDEPHSEPMLPLPDVHWSADMVLTMEIAYGMRQDISLFQCCVCSEAAAQVYCFRCEAHFCGACDRTHHPSMSPLGSHHRSKMEEGRLTAHAPLCSCDNDVRAHHYHATSPVCLCGGPCAAELQVIEVHHKFGPKAACVLVCGAMDPVGSLVLLGLYPASEVCPRTCFTQEVMESFHNDQLKKGVTLHTAYAGHLSLQQEFIQHNLVILEPNDHDRQSLQSLLHVYKDIKTNVQTKCHGIHAKGILCPACHAGGVSLGFDVQFKSKNIRRPKAKQYLNDCKLADEDPTRGLLFGPRTAVDSFVESKGAGATFEGGCGNKFLAVENAHRTKGEKHLATTAMMSAVCRHDLWAKAVQLRHGERHAYATIALLAAQELVDKNGQLDTQRVQASSESGLLRFLARIYDIDCIYDPGLQQLHRILPPGDLKVAIGLCANMIHGHNAGHVMGHKMWCQLFETIWNKLGCGMADHEGNERVQAHVISHLRALKWSTQLNFRR